MEIKKIYLADLTVPFLDELSIHLEEGFYDSAILWKKRFDYWWGSNPYIQADSILGWVLIDDNENIVGFHGSIPIGAQYNNKRLLGAGGTSYYVKPNARGRLSTILLLEFPRQKDRDFTTLTTVNSHARKAACAMGYTLLSEKPINNYVIITSLASFMGVGAYMSKHFADANLGWKKTLFNTISRVAGLISNILPSHTQEGETHPISINGYSFQNCKSACSFLDYLSRHRKESIIELSKDEISVDWMYFSPAVQNLLSRKIILIFTESGEYCGYFVYDKQHAGNATTIRLRELQLLKCDEQLIKQLIKYLKVEAKRDECAAVYIGLQNATDEIDSLLHKNIKLCLKTENRYFVKFRKGVIQGRNPYDIFVPSDLDPDVGFI